MSRQRGRSARIARFTQFHIEAEKDASVCQHPDIEQRVCQVTRKVRTIGNVSGFNGSGSPDSIGEGSVDPMSSGVVQELVGFTVPSGGSRPQIRSLGDSVNSRPDGG